MEDDTRIVALPAGLDPIEVLGAEDSTLRLVQESFPNTQIFYGDGVFNISGSAGEVQLVANLLEEIVVAAQQGEPVQQATVARAVNILLDSQEDLPADTTGVFESVSWAGRTVQARSPGQQRYLQALSDNQVVFGIGPAGTGKTYLAMAAAVEALLAGKVRRLVLTRPAVEAGENLGYLPGSLTEKIDPYLRPLFDALQDLLSDQVLPELMEAGAIEVAPLAYMRGRTLNDAFIILDEAQNTTPAQMKMALTRLGQRSKMVVTGDVTQVDLPRGTISGLSQAEEVLRDVEGINITYLTSGDVVRTRLVADIVDAYQEWEGRQPHGY